VFLGREISQSKDYSEATAQVIDEEVRRFVDDAEARAQSLLGQNQDKLHVLANALLEREIMDGEEIDRLLKGGSLEPLPARGNGRPAESSNDGAKDEAKDGANDRTPAGDGRQQGANEPSRASGTD
jgi:cell division protease FtsH